MRYNQYLILIFLIGIILLRGNILNLINNISSYFLTTDNQFEIMLLQTKNERLSNDLDEVLDFKNNIEINHDYIITNAIRNNYGFHKLIINGSDYQIGDEVVNINGLVGVISSINTRTSEVTLLHNANIVVKINDEKGIISHQDNQGNLIIKEVSNYNNIRLNDRVYSLMGSYIGRVIRIRYGIIDHYLTIERKVNQNLNFVAVISR